MKCSRKKRQRFYANNLCLAHEGAFVRIFLGWAARMRLLGEMLELFTFLVSKGMKWGSLFHIEVGELGRLDVFEFIEQDGNLVLVGNQATRLNLESRFDGFESLGKLLLVGEQVKAFELARVVLPWSVSDRLAMKP